MGRADQNAATVRNASRIVRRMASSRAKVHDVFASFLPVRDIGEGQPSGSRSPANVKPETRSRIRASRSSAVESLDALSGFEDLLSEFRLGQVRRSRPTTPVGAVRPAERTVWRST